MRRMLPLFLVAIITITNANGVYALASRDIGSNLTSFLPTEPAAVLWLLDVDLVGKWKGKKDLSFAGSTGFGAEEYLSRQSFTNRFFLHDKGYQSDRPLYLLNHSFLFYDCA